MTDACNCLRKVHENFSDIRRDAYISLFFTEAGEAPLISKVSETKWNS